VGQLHARLAKARPTKTPGACGKSEPKPKSLKRWASSIDGSFNKTRMSRVETGDFLRISGEKMIEQVIRVAFCSLGEDKKLDFFAMTCCESIDISTCRYGEFVISLQTFMQPSA